MYHNGYWKYILEYSICQFHGHKPSQLTVTDFLDGGMFPVARLLPPRVIIGDRLCMPPPLSEKSGA